MDVSWNPCHDAQAICRVYRYGQTKPCYIYRLIADFTMEKRIYDRQVTKQGISNRVVDELPSSTQFTRSEVANLFYFAVRYVLLRQLPNLYLHAIGRRETENNRSSKETGRSLR